MKRLLTCFISAALVLSCTTVSASAHRHGRALDLICGGVQTGCLRSACVEQCSRHGANCADEDNDGVCDHYDSGRCPGNGLMGGGYVDADSNGVCDNYDSEYCVTAGGGYVSHGHHNSGGHSGRGHGNHHGG